MTQLNSGQFPDSISFAQLKELASQAEADTQSEPAVSNAIQQAVEERCFELMNVVSEKTQSYMDAKVLALMLLKSLVNWAEANYDTAKERNEIDPAVHYGSIVSDLSNAAVIIQHSLLGDDDFCAMNNHADDTP